MGWTGGREEVPGIEHIILKGLKQTSMVFAGAGRVDIKTMPPVECPCSAE
jgi:hypothetical protein